MAASAARNTMIPQPASFQITCEVTSSAKVSGLVMTSHVPMSLLRRKWFTAPAPPSICWKIVIASTHEKKCGRYTTDWMKLRTRCDSTELSSNASAIGIGKNRISCTKLRYSVLRTEPQNSGSPISRSNW